MNARRLLVAKLTTLLLAATSLLLNAGEILEFHGMEDFKPYVLTNETLAISGIDVVTLKTGKRHLLALGAAQNPSGTNSTVRMRLDARKVAESKARKTAAEFIKVDVSVDEKLVELRNTEKVSNNEGVRNQVTKLIKIREEVIRQRSQVVFAGSKTVATWLSENGEIFNAVIAFDFEKSN